MAINKKLIHFKNFSDFNSKKLSANENNTQYTLGIEGTVTNGSPDILYQSICYIKDTKQQWTHGQLYDGTNLNEAGFLAGEETSDQLDDVETNTYVKYVPQTLTDEQKAQTRINIGAVSGDNFKTINGASILGSGDIEISGGDAIDTSNLVQYEDVYGVKANYITCEEYHGITLSLDRYGFTYTDAFYPNNPKYISFTYTGDGTKFLSDDGTYKTISGGGSSSGGSGAYSEVNHGTSDTTFTLTPNTFHVWDEVASLTLDFGNETGGVANEYLFQFTSGATATSLTLPDDIKWANELSIEPNMIYQVSILKGLASVLEFDNAPNLIENHITYDEGNMPLGGTITFEYPTASELTFVINNYRDDTLIVPQGSTYINVEWYEPIPPAIISFSPTEDSIYKYILS